MTKKNSNSSKASKLVGEVDKEKVVDVEAEFEDLKPGKRTPLFFYFVSFVILMSALAFLGYKFLLGKDWHLKALEHQVGESELLVLQEVDEPAREVKVVKKETLEQNDLSYGGALQGAGAEDSLPGIVVEVVEPVQEEILVAVEEHPQSEAVVLDVQVSSQQNAEVGALKQKNRNIVLYLSAQNLEEIVTTAGRAIDVKSLQKELGFFKQASAGGTEYIGKVQILEYSLESGLPSVAELSVDLDALAKTLDENKEKTFWVGFKDAVLGLVKVTKLDENQEGAEGEYAKIILAKKALQAGGLNKSIDLVETLEDEASKAWVEKAYKLQRARSSVADLLDMIRKKLVL